MNLVVSDSKAESVRSTLGARASYPFETGAGFRVALESRVGWMHEFRDPDSVTARLAGDPTATGFGVSGPAFPRDSLLLGLGIAAENRRSVRLFVDLSAEHNGVHQSLGFSAGLRYHW